MQYTKYDLDSCMKFANPYYKICLERTLSFLINIIFRCGDADKEIMSVYCLESRCEAKNIRDAPICGTRLPHDSHGCIEGNLIDWRRAHNVRNFSASINDHSACVWECKV